MDASKKTKKEIVDDKGSVIGLVGIARNITERQKVEKVLKESEEHARIFASYQHAVSELRQFYAMEASFEQMLQKTVDLFVKNFGYYMTWYGELKVSEKVIIPKVWAGKYEKYLDGLRLELDDSKDAKCAMSLAIVRKEPFGYADLEHDKDFEKWRPLALKYGYRSNQAVPLIIGGESIGAFLIYGTRPGAFSEILIQYLEGITNELATIIEKITERKEAEEQLGKYRKHLEEMVEKRTTELKATNEQLRREVTERKETEGLLREAKEHTDRVIEGMLEAVTIIDLDGTIRRVNGEFERGTGWKRQEAVGKTAIKLGIMSKEEGHRVEKEIIPKLMNKGFVRNIETTVTRRDGTRFFALMSWALMRDAEGEPTGIIAVAMDITKRKKAEEKIKLFSDAIAGAIDAIAITDIQGNITYANPAKEKVYGYEKGELIGKHVSTLNAKPEMVEEMISALMKTGSWKGEVLQQKKNKEIFPALLSLSTVKDEKGNPIGMMGAVRDITKQKQAGKKLLTYQKQLQLLASKLSVTEEHERRRLATELHDHMAQPLVFSKMKLDKYWPSMASTDLGKSLKEISNTLEQVIDGTQNLTYDLGSPTLYELGLEAAIKEWLTEEIEAKHNITTVFEDDGVPKPLSNDINAFVLRAVRELTVNVVKHAQVHNLKVSLQREADKIIICVTDDGIGFKPLDTGLPKDKGSGYGLFSIKERLSHIGGDLDVKSEPGHGTQAVLIVPLVEKDTITGD